MEVSDTKQDIFNAFIVVLPLFRRKEKLYKGVSEILIYSRIKVVKSPRQCFDVNWVKIFVSESFANILQEITVCEIVDNGKISKISVKCTTNSL